MSSKKLHYGYIGDVLLSYLFQFCQAAWFLYAHHRSYHGMALLSVCPSVCLSVCPSHLRFSVCPSIPCVCLSVHPFVCPSVSPSVCPSIHQSVSPSVHPSVCQSIRLSARPPAHPSVRLSAHPSVCLSAHIFLFCFWWCDCSLNCVWNMLMFSLLIVSFKVFFILPFYCTTLFLSCCEMFLQCHLFYLFYHCQYCCNLFEYQL